MHSEKNPTEIARKILNENIHLTLATFDSKPWATPVYYCSDDKFNIYFTSKPDSLHGQHIAKNPEVSFAIYDSKKYQNGIQGIGSIKILKGKEILAALKWYKTDFMKLSLKTLSGLASYRLYKITSEHIFIQDPNKSSDKRIEVAIA